MAKRKLSPDEKSRLNERLADAARTTDGRLTASIARGYGAAVKDIDREIERLAAKMDAALEAGETVNAGWLARAGRLLSLKDTAERALSAFATEAAPDIVDTKRDLIVSGSEHGAELLEALLGPAPAAAADLSVSFDVMNTAAAEKLAERANTGNAPIRTVLARYNTETQKRIEETVFSGVARGRNPTAIARDLRGDLNVGAYNALRFARTEVITAYRDARLDTFQRNADFVSGWEWAAADDERTCPFCAEMDGTVHDLDEPFETHPNCRCSPKPITKDWDAILEQIRENAA